MHTMRRQDTLMTVTKYVFGEASYILLIISLPKTEKVLWPLFLMNSFQR
jgi:hypothetical protein